MASIPIFTVDAFSAESFRGNPAAICLIASSCEDKLPESLMQKIASEMNLSETAFIFASSEKSFREDSHFRLRWFTPKCEVSLCGHATLASAAVLFQEQHNETGQITFDTLSGPLLSRKQGNNQIVIDLPLNTPKEYTGKDLDGFVKAVIGDCQVGDIQYSPSTKKLLIRLDDTETREALESLKPKSNELTSLSLSLPMNVMGVIVTLVGCKHCRRPGDGTEGYDFVSRYFAPWVGIPEDPVTGSAHTVLAPYWGQKLGSKSLKAHQCSERGGDLELTVREDGRVDIVGKAKTVLKGSLYL